MDKTIGRIQFLITVEYADHYIRKYKTLIDSFTILMTVFNIITKFCWFLNYFLTKSYLYSTIFEPIVKNSPRPFNESFESNINIRNNYFGSYTPSTSQLHLSQKKKESGDLSIIKLNNKNNNAFNKSILNNSSLAPIKNLEIQKNDEINKILMDIQSRLPHLLRK